MNLAISLYPESQGFEFCYSAPQLTSRAVSSTPSNTQWLYYVYAIMNYDLWTAHQPSNKEDKTTIITNVNSSFVGTWLNLCHMYFIDFLNFLGCFHRSYSDILTAIVHVYGHPNYAGSVILTLPVFPYLSSHLSVPPYLCWSAANHH